MLAGTRPRVLRGVAATMSWQSLGSDGEPATTDPGTVTVGVIRSDGTVVIAAGTATAGTGTDPRTIDIPIASMTLLDILTAIWTIAGVDVATTSVEVVGGFYFTSADLRSAEPSTADVSRDRTSKVLASRAEVETMFEDLCGVAFVPRFAVDQFTCGDVRLSWARVRAIRWVRTWSGGTSTDYTAAQLALIRTNGVSVVFPTRLWGDLVEVGYEHGYDAPPFDVKRVSLVAARIQGNMARSGVPDRATSMQLADGGSVTLATPGVGRWHYGVPEIDDVLRRYDHRALIA